MDNVSVSKGVFAYKGAYKVGQKRKKIGINPLINEPWYQAYIDAWSIIKNAAEGISGNMFKQILKDVKQYVINIRDMTIDECSNEISTAILLTGVNLPDHDTLFGKLSSKLSSVTQQIAVIASRHSGNMKSLVEETIYQLINNNNEDEIREVKKNQCNFRVLEAWYSTKCTLNTPLIIIIPDFESFNSGILRDFILVLSSYAKTIKFVLVFGVATTLHAVHRSLSYDVTSKLRVQVFHTQTQIKSLSDVLEGTVLSGKSSFMLTGRAFQLLTDIFLFYDFSVNGFLQGYKLCMIQHFYGSNLTSLCCNRTETKSRLKQLTSDDLKELEKLPSIIKYFEKFSVIKSITEIDNKELRRTYLKLLNEFHDFIESFFVILKCLHCLTASLPGAPLGKQLREVYANAVTCDLIDTQEYKESMQLLNFMSKEELIIKLKNIIEIICESSNVNLEELFNNLQNHLNVIENASLEIVATTETVTPSAKLNRIQFQEKLKQLSQNQSRSPFKQAQIDLINYLNKKIFSVYLINPNRLPCSEIFCFSDANAGKQHLRGSLRAAIHMGLNDPQVYLNCICCKLENDQTIQPTLPDLSIVYKLHLESRKLINMYDWLQAFLMIVNPNDDSEQTEIDPAIQARFTRAVAELQFLGFIKTSRRKTDHVKRLT